MLRTPDLSVAAHTLTEWVRQAFSKTASGPSAVSVLTGRLYASSSGWVLLSVPNALVRGLFDTLQLPGVELPLSEEGRLEAHISVIHPDEVEKLGGVDAISERGHTFRYQLGPVKEVEPASWDGVSRVWFVEVKSPELEQLRKSYGLSARPRDNRFQFHITFALRKKRVLFENDVSKLVLAG